MGGATLTQKLLGKPSTSYSSGNKQHRQSLYETTQYSHRTGSSVRSGDGASSMRSYYSAGGSGAATPIGATGAYGGSLSRAGSIALSERSLASSAMSGQQPGGWVNGQWEWAAFGGRGGLTRGPASIHPSDIASDIGVKRSSRRKNRTTMSDAGSFRADSDFDNQSFRSVRTSRSYSSVKSGMSTRSQQLGNTGQWMHASPSLTMGPPTRSTGKQRIVDISSLVTKGSVEPSRKYSSMSPTPSVVSSSSRHQPRSRVSRTLSTDSPMSEVPSLTSSQSSTRDSPPLTPVSVPYDVTSQYPTTSSSARKQSKKKVKSPIVVAQEDELERPVSRLSDRKRRNSKRTSAVDPEETAVLPVSSAVGIEREAAGACWAREEHSHAISEQQVDLAPDVDEGKTTVLNDGAASSSDSRSESGSEDEAESEPEQFEIPVEVPRISLTRTESDQSAYGIHGDVDVLEQERGVEQAHGVTRKKSKRTSDKIVGPTYPPVTLEVVKSSPTKPTKRKSKSSRRAESESAGNPEDSLSETSSAAAADDTQWLKRIKALGEPIDPLLKDVPVARKKGKNKEPQLHWTVKQYEERQSEERQRQQQVVRPIHRPSSLGNLRRPRWDALEPMPEQDEHEESVISRASKISVEPLPEIETPAPPFVVDPEPRLSESSADSGRTSRKAEGSTYDIVNALTETPQNRPASPEVALFAVAPFPVVGKGKQRTRSLSPVRSRSRHDSNSMPPVTTPYSIPPPATPLPFHIPTAADEGFVRPRAMSSTSDTPSVQSIGGFSTMSMPTGAYYRPPKNPARAQQRHSMFVASQMTSKAGSVAGTDSVSGVAAGHMATLSVAATALARPPAPSSGGGFSLFRRIEPPITSSAAAARRFDAVRDLSYSNLQPLPKKVKSDEVMVQVFAAGVDKLDVERTKEMASRPDGFGFVPGRAFYGKVLDTGIEVKLVKRGDLVYGLMPMKKSSTLSEVVTVPKDRLTVAPSDSPLSVEQVAILPVTAVPALFAMEMLCGQLPRGSKILVLNAHEGIGNLCLQLANHLRPARDLFVVAHCPITAYEGGEYCRATGASHVIVDEPLSTLNGLHESEFDVVIDTIGGRRLYDASRRVLHHTGTFVTTIGDTPSVTSSSQWKTSFRSLRRTFIKKDKKLVKFMHISSETVAQRDESVRDILDRVRIAVVEGGLKPRVDRIWSLEEASGAFKDAALSGAGSGHAASGKVIRVKQV
ncbi:hypothetical protein OIO90_005040 [Microbotryomycetes sp. JL221]|nr:hypothetical protein OIO90_005040 [Microbotryomycetes sp. JL221]